MNPASQIGSDQPKPIVSAELKAQELVKKDVQRLALSIHTIAYRTAKRQAFEPRLCWILKKQRENLERRDKDWTEAQLEAYMLVNWMKYIEQEKPTEESERKLQLNTANGELKYWQNDYYKLSLNAEKEKNRLRKTLKFNKKKYETLEQYNKELKDEIEELKRNPKPEQPEDFLKIEIAKAKAVAQDFIKACNEIEEQAQKSELSNEAKTTHLVQEPKMIQDKSLDPKTTHLSQDILPTQDPKLTIQDLTQDLKKTQLVQEPKLIHEMTQPTRDFQLVQDPKLTQDSIQNPKMAQDTQLSLLEKLQNIKTHLETRQKNPEDLQKQIKKLQEELRLAQEALAKYQMV